MVSFDLIEHFNKSTLIDVTDNVRRVLKPRGKWLLHVPNAESPFFGRVRYGDFTHELAFTSQSLSSFLKASGFHSVRCLEDGPVPHGLKSIIRFLSWKLLRKVIRVAIVIETGELAKASIFTQNMFAVAELG